MYDMPNMHELDVQGLKNNGGLRPCNMRIGKALDVLPTAAHMPAAQNGDGKNARSPRKVAKQKIISLTAQNWGI